MTVRFYGQLNDFLPYRRRHVRFRHELRERSSVKDVIESLGVPHPEVDLILVNGSPAPFTRVIDERDHVAVFPFFHSIDLGDVVHAGSPPPMPIRFALDEHLQKLASWLRLAGFDALLYAGDAEVAEAGIREQRVVLTRDVALLKRSIVRHGYWVRHTDPEKQLAEVLRRFDLVPSMAPFTRCTQCNTLLVPAPAEAVRDRLLPCTRAEFEQFHECPGCGRVYWRGSHYTSLQSVLDRAVGLAHPS